jgi:hypothetical protein
MATAQALSAPSDHPQLIALPHKNMALQRIGVVARSLNSCQLQPLSAALGQHGAEPEPSCCRPDNENLLDEEVWVEAARTINVVVALSTRSRVMKSQILLIMSIVDT